MNPTEPAHLTAKQLALYLGCEVEYKNEIATMYGVHTNQIMLSVVDHPHGEVCRSSEVKPILRRLESISDEEAQECFIDEWSGDSPNVGEIVEQFGWKDIHFKPENFEYLLLKGFDLFGFIELGLALDQEAIKK